MKKTCTIICFMLIWILSATPAMSQNFDQLLEAVDKLEASLTTMVKVQSDKSDAQIASLEKRFNELYASQNSSGANGSLSDDELAQLRHLKDQVHGMTALTAMKEENDKLLAGLVNEVSAVSTQLKSLQLEFSTLELADGSAKDDNSANSTSEINPVMAEKMSGFTQSLASIESRLNDLKSKDQTFATPLNEGLTFSGFVDASAVSDFQPGETGFHMDQVEIDVSKNLTNKASLRADIQAVENGSGEFGIDLEQAYMTYQFESELPWTFTFGKFNAPIGFELLDAPDMYQFSHALVFDLGLPTNVTGLMVNKKFSSKIDLTTYAANGWDVNADNNTGKTFGLRFGVAPTESFGFGFSAITGPEQDDSNKGRRNVFDVDVTLNASETWLLGGELNYGRETHSLAGGKHGEWFGFMMMSNVALGEKFGLTQRVGYFKDTNGLRTGVEQNVLSLTVSPSVSIAEGLGGLFEIRYNRFSETDPSIEVSEQVVTAFEFTHAF